MKQLPLICLLVSGTCLGQAPAAPLDLGEAIELAIARPTPADAETTVARARLAWLEASSHRRVELKPQSALWSLVNPIALATNVGVSLLSGGGAVSPLALLDAKIDVASADIAAQHVRFQREVEVTEKYNVLALQQQWASQACLAVDEAVEQRQQAQEELRSSRATRLDVIWHEQTVVDRKADCRRSDQATNIAAVALSTLLHGSVENIRAADIRVETSSDKPLQSAEVLYDLAGIYREDLAQRQSAKQQILDLWDALEATHDSRSRIVLKDNGAFEAQKRLLAEKIRRLEAQSEELSLQIQARIAEIRIRIESLHDQLDLAEERMALAIEQGDITWVRLRAGLAERSDMLRAKELEQEVSTEVARLRQEDSTNVAALVAIVGLRDEPESLQELVYDATVLSARNH